MAPLIILFTFIACITNSLVADAITAADLCKLASVMVSPYPQASRSQSSLKLPLKIKKRTFYIYIAGVNDLRFWARKNIQEMLAIGSSDQVNIIIELHTILPGNQRISRRYYVEKNNLVLLDQGGPKDSGKIETLVDFFKFGLDNFPAEQICFIFWNHGTGPIDIERSRVISAAALYEYNPSTNMLELNRAIPFFDYILMQDPDPRGICYDDLTGSYLSNTQLVSALEKCVELNGKPIDIIGFDACLMANIEVCIMLKRFAHYLVGSSELEPGSGWRYDYVLAPFAKGMPTSIQFAKHVVASYKKAYEKIMPDYTQSAIDLGACTAIEQDLNKLANLLMDALNKQIKNSVQLAIRTARHPNKCTYFGDPSIIDLDHFCENLDGLVERMQIQDGNRLKREIRATLVQLRRSIAIAVVANVAGPNLSKAKGLSIYLPERRAHKNYFYGPFAKINAWAQFVGQYIAQ